MLHGLSQTAPKRSARVWPTFSALVAGVTALIALAPTVNAEVDSSVGPKGAWDLHSLSEYDVSAEIATFKERHECWDQLDIYYDWEIGMLKNEFGYRTHWARNPEELWSGHFFWDGATVQGEAGLTSNTNPTETEISSLSEAQKAQLWEEYTKLGGPSFPDMDDDDFISFLAVGEGAISNYYNEDGSVKSFEPGNYPPSHYDGLLDSQDLKFCMYPARAGGRPYPYQFTWSRFSRL